MTVNVLIISPRVQKNLLILKDCNQTFSPPYFFTHAKPYKHSLPPQVCKPFSYSQENTALE